MRWRDNITAFVGYFLLTLLLTYPLALEFTQKVPGHYDVWQNTWNFWWVGKAVFDLKTSVWHTPYLFHPTGVGLAFHTLNLGNSFVGAALSRLASLAVAYNTLVFGSFVLAGYGMFLLAEYVTKNRHAAFFAGIVYAFMPYHFMEVDAGHLNLLSIQWIPFYILYLMKTFREGGRRNATLTAIFLFAVASTCLQYLGFAGLLMALYLVFEWKNEKKKFASNVYRRVLPSIILAGVLILPVTYPTIAATIRGEGASPALFASIVYSQDAASFVVPHAMHPLWGRVGRAVAEGVGRRGDGLTAKGYAVLLLLLFYFNREYQLLRRLKSSARKTIKLLGWRLQFAAVVFSLAVILHFISGYQVYHVWAIVLSTALAFLLYLVVRYNRLGFWEASLIVFGVLSLGPIVNFFGYLTLPAPYMLLQFIPGFRVFRVPARFEVLFMLAASVLCAKALAGVKTKKQNPLIILLSAVVLIEYLSIPLPMSAMNVSGFFSDISADGGDYAILNVPVSPIHHTRGNTTFENGLPHYMLHQTVHGKRMVGGYVSYPTRETRDFIAGNVFLRRMRSLEMEFNDSRRVLVDAGRTTLSENNIRYIIVHKDVISSPILYEKDTLNKTLDIVSDVVGEREPVFEDDRIRVYETLF